MRVPDLTQWITISIATAAALRVPSAAEAARRQGLRRQLVDSHSFAETEVSTSACVTKGKEYRDHVAVTYDGATGHGVCQHLCNQQADCEFFTYLSDTKRCTLHTQNPTDGAANPHAFAGPKRCPVCVMRGWDFRNEPNMAHGGQPGIRTLADCEAGCKAEQKCHYFLFDHSLKLCHWKVREQALVALTQDNRYDAGPKTCTSSHWCIMPRTDYYGNDIANKSSASPEDCQTKCLNDAKCEYFTYIPGRKQCWMKAGAKVPGTKKANEKTLSGPKHCGLPTAVIAEGTKYTGATLSTQPRSEIGSFAGCQMACWNNTKCVFFHFDKDSCTLSGIAARPESDASSRGGNLAL